ncbi:MAG TPA: SPFH domain-containing protein, partial [Acidimicrobiales bacterium]|nr:SPFH domain-containing protein [Acidimicrobiales bacterium]
AVPDDRKGQIVFKWPDVNIRKMTRAIVDADELAVFINTGQVVGTMGPGRHQIDANELPFLGAIVDWATGGNAYRAELYFVGTREYTGNTFGGRIDDVQDPQTGMIVTLRVFGDYSLQVSDPGALITRLVGTVDVTNNQAITSWVSDQLLKVMRTQVTTQIVRNGWPILGLSAYTTDIEQTVIEKGNEQLATYGLRLIRMGNFDVNLSDDDEAQLKTLAKDTAYSRLAGSFGQYASGEMQLGAGEGMAKGGGATGGAFLAAGLGLGGQASAPAQPGPPPPPAPGFAGGGAGYVGGGPAPSGSAPAGTVECRTCHTANAAAAKFCASCGTSLAPPTQSCENCEAQNPVGARFCANCGQPLGPQPVHCPSCGEEVAPGAKFCPSCGTAIAPAAPAASS